MWKGYGINRQIKITKMHSFFKETFDKSYSFCGEAHNFWECMYVIGGNICVSADERIYNLGKGEVIFHKPMELHKFYVTGGSDAEAVVFSFSAEGGLCKFFKDKVFSLTEEQRAIVEDMIEYAEKHKVPLSSEERRITLVRYYMLAFESVSTYSQTIETYLYRLFLSIAEDNKTFDASDSKESMVFRKTVRYMQKNVCTNLSVEDIAWHVNTSEASLKRLFSQYAGMGVHKYFLMLKLKYAISLISNGMTVTETADKLEFSSQGYFTTVFKREMGYLPSEIKKSL